ncbi:hypothetical protein K449DRAFT_433181 [Hypoxylon sp. EC38]|nr:hypothetical protein K449DRAFT_433181 [Hypoxylon sp. EC38]
MHNVENRKCQNPIISSSSMRREPAISHSFGYSGMGPPFPYISYRTTGADVDWRSACWDPRPLIPEWGSGGRDRPGAASCRSDGSYWMFVLLLEVQQISAAMTATSLMGKREKEGNKRRIPTP